LKRFYYDTVVHDEPAIRSNMLALIRFCSARIAFDMGVERPAEIACALGLPKADEAKISAERRPPARIGVVIWRLFKKTSLSSFDTQTRDRLITQ
jgi:hypothetical protein